MQAFNDVMAYADRLYPHQIADIALCHHYGYLKDHRHVTIKGKSGEPVTMIACDLVDLAKELIKHKNRMENL